MQLIDEYLQWYAAGDPSPRTIELRRTQLTRFAEAVGDLAAVTELDVVRYVSNPRWAAGTRKSVRAALKGFYQWATRTGVVAIDPMLWVRPIRQEPTIPKPITEDALALALDRATPEQELMLLLGAYAGLRRAEIAAVHSDHLQGEVLIVHGKGRKFRAVPIHPRLAPFLDDLDGFAFPSQARPGGHVTHDYVHDRLMKVLPAPWTPHTLRHRFATQVYRNTKDLSIVSALLGHAKVETTMAYVAVNRLDLADAVAMVS